MMRITAVSAFCLLSLPALILAATSVSLGPSVNSPGPEGMPLISPDGRTLYFYRDKSAENIGSSETTDIWSSTLSPDGTWGPAVNLGKPVNNAGNNFPCSITPDGNILVVGNVYNRDGTMTSGVSWSRRTPTGWSFPVKLSITGYKNISRGNSFYLCNDGKTLLLSIQDPGDTFGGRDLYVSFLVGDRKWTRPRNLGSGVNTPKSELTPFLASDGVSLYFASDGLPGGYGGCDIWVSRKLDGTWTNWSVPENLGPEINTPGEERGYTIPASGTTRISSRTPPRPGGTRTSTASNCRNGSGPSPSS